MEKDKTARFRRLLKSLDVSYVLLTDPCNIQWLTGAVLNWPPGPSPFDAIGPLLFWDGSRAHLIVADSDALGIESDDELEVIPYETYTIDRPMAPFAAQANALEQALGHVKASGRVGIEYARAHIEILDRINRCFSGGDCCPIDNLVNPLRAVKTRTELRAIRQTLKLCDAGQRTARRAVAAGRTEIDCYCKVWNVMAKRAGKPMSIAADFVAGDRASQIGGPASDNIIRPGDFVIVDLVPRLDGFWGDNCCTYVAGEASAEQRRMFDCVTRALQAGTEMVKPGVRPSDIDAKVRDVIRSEGFVPHPHHTGHGIGYSYHEEPRIVGYNDTPLEKNMVFCMEPGIYIEGQGGVRLEDAIRVTDDGAEVLTTHSKMLD